MGNDRARRTGVYLTGAVRGVRRAVLSFAFLLAAAAVRAQDTRPSARVAP